MQMIKARHFAAQKNHQKIKLKNFKKGVDKTIQLCYNNLCELKGFPQSSAGVAELADARDLKSRDTKVSYRFDPGHRHHSVKNSYRGVEQLGSSSGS